MLNFTEGIEVMRFKATVDRISSSIITLLHIHRYLQNYARRFHFSGNTMANKFKLVVQINADKTCSDLAPVEVVNGLVAQPLQIATEDEGAN
ncbi:MAG: hypothetical protein ACP5OK_09790 [Thermoprotei archaeon]